MLSNTESATEKLEKGRVSVLVFDQGRDLEIVGKLNLAGFQAKGADRELSLLTLIEDGRPEALVLVWNPGVESSTRLLGDVSKIARRLEIPFVCVVDGHPDGEKHDDALSNVDDWLFAANLDTELALRLRSLRERQAKLRKSSSGFGSPVADSHFFALVVHDLRTPLNVIGLSLRMISQSIPKGDPDLDEDLRFVEENFAQIERMLMQLSDYFRLFENNGPLSPIEFSPRRAVDELLSSRSNKPALKFGVVELVVKDSCPEVVALDPSKARLAIAYVLANATAAAGSTPIHLTLSGRNGHFIAETTVDSPAPSSVKSTALSPLSFLRLCGFAAERRGMDLAIAAKVSELFGGHAKLDVYDDKKTTVVLEWPLTLTEAGHD